MKTEIIMPRIGINDNYVTLAQWLVDNGEKVVADTKIAVIETAKETSEIIAPVDGYINFISEMGSDVKIGDVIAEISDNEHSTKDLDGKVASNEHQEYKISEKAKKLIDEHEIDINLLPKQQIIREKDVLKLIKKPFHIRELATNKLLICGGGGFSKMIIEILNQRGEYKICGILDRKYGEVDQIKGIPIIDSYGYDEMQRLYDEGYRIIINAIAFDGNNHYRKEPYEQMKEIGFVCCNAIHDKAILEPSAVLGESNLIAAGAIIGSDTVIGNNCIINTGAIIAHDCIISDSCHIASGAVLGGNVIVGENTLIGQGCTIFKGVKIGHNVIIMNGVNVFENIPDGETVVR